MVDVSREGKGMKLSDTILLYDLQGICEVSIGLTRKSDDEISSDIESESIFSFHVSEFFEDFSELHPIVVAIHRLQDFRGS